MDLHNADNFLSDFLTLVMCWYSSLGRWSSLNSFVGILYDDHIERFTSLENTLLRRSVVHPRRGHRALDGMG
jgi:hypothetical protein